MTGPAESHDRSRPDEPPDEAWPGGEDRSVLADVASTLAGVASPVRAAVDHLAAGARRAISERPGARVRRVRRMGREPLASLWELHPEARRASIRELGLDTVPVDRIAGTAVEGAPQRGGDFLPLRDRRSGDWQARWQRIRRAVDALESLPPIELIKFGDRYWVVDGHNRVAAALYNGQDAIDADVVELRLPGMEPTPAPTTVAPVLEGSLDLRAAGAGRLTRAVARPSVAPIARPAAAPDTDEQAAAEEPREPAE